MIAIGAESKACTGCGEVKPLDREHWFRDLRHSDGFQSWCKVCAIESNRRRAARMRAAFDPDPDPESAWRGEWRGPGVAERTREERDRRLAQLADHAPPSAASEVRTTWAALTPEAASRRIRRLWKGRKLDIWRETFTEAVA